MIRFFGIFIFFVTFYKITFFYSYAYPSLLVGLLCLFLFFYKKHRVLIMNWLGGGVLLACFVLFFNSFIIDIFSDALLNDFLNSFSIRLISILLISLLPAYFFCGFLIKGSYDEAVKVIIISFYIQLFFWIVTFINPDFKILLTGFMGGSENSVNLKEHNLHVRGFGLSNDINYTTPFMTVLVSYLFLNNIKLGVLSTLTQIVNSNLVLLSVAIVFVFSKIKLHWKIISGSILFFAFFILGKEFFPRLYSEFSSGDSRTFNTLYYEHITIVANDFLSHFFGVFEYTFKGGRVSSDIGWIIMYNYGGFLFTLEFVFLLLALSFAAFGKNWFTIVWFFIGVLLNTKGLLFGPNSYYFMTFVCIFLRNSNGYSIMAHNKV